MPEATIHKDARSVFPQYQVRMPWQSFVIQPIAESPSPQSTPYNHLRLRILRVDSSHILVPLLWSELIHSYEFSTGINNELISVIYDCLIVNPLGG